MSVLLYRLRPLLCQINPAQTITFCVYKIHFNITSMVNTGLERIKSNMWLNFIILETLNKPGKHRIFLILRVVSFVLIVLSVHGLLNILKEEGFGKTCSTASKYIMVQTCNFFMFLAFKSHFEFQYCTKSVREKKAGSGFKRKKSV